MSGSASGTYVWNPTAQKLIYGALRLLSAIESGEAPPDDEYQDAIDALNGLIKQWQGSGIHLWAEEDCTLFLQPNQISYQLAVTSPDHVATTLGSTITGLSATALSGATSVTLTTTTGLASGNQVGIWLDTGSTFWTTASGAPSGNVVPLASALPSQATSGNFAAFYAATAPRPLRVPAARLLFISNATAEEIEVPMMPMSRLYYASVPDKTTPGTVTQFFFDPQNPIAQMYVWPAPSNAQTALRFTAQFPLQDVNNGAQATGFPAEWFAALRFNLARELSLEYDCPPQRLEQINLMAAEKLAMAQMWDREPESVRFGVGYYPAQRN